MCSEQTKFFADFVSVQPEDSEPNEGTSEVDENRQLNIAATVMSWLDNYGQARGCNLGSHGTSLIIQRDDLSRRGSAGSIDMDDEAEVTSIQTRAAVVIANPINDDDGMKEDETTLEAACSMIIKCHNDLQPLVSHSSMHYCHLHDDAESLFLILRLNACAPSKLQFTGIHGGKYKRSCLPGQTLCQLYGHAHRKVELREANFLLLSDFVKIWNLKPLPSLPLMRQTL